MFRRLALSGLLFASVATLILPGAACATEEEQAQIKRLEARLTAMQAQVDALSKIVGTGTAKTTPPPVGLATGASAALPARAASVAAPAQAPSPQTLETTALKSSANAGAPIYAGDGRYLERKPGRGLTFVTPNGEVTAYGNFDVALEGATKGISGLTAPDGSRPVGHLGWQPDVSTNLSFIGVRGFQTLAGGNVRFIYQLETQIDISAMSGVGENNSSESNVVKGGLTSRNSYIGFAESHLGAISIGKTDAPYKQSTLRMNPFIGMVGDYAAIMGNTGGDNRVEFATRLDHSIWYESPEYRGLKFNALYSPGQNRGDNSDNIAAGESDCTGGNVPGSGGSLPIACNDGAFSDAVSASLSYTNGPLYLTAAYERHGHVNRASDITGLYANPPAAFVTADVADEDAFKAGMQLTLPTQTTVSGIFETMHRYIPGELEFQNERQRSGFWLSATQALGPRDTLAFGWAHANRAPGDPGQHNTSVQLPPFGSPGDAAGGADQDNSADLLTLALKHSLGGGLWTYLDVAALENGPFAHYALGAGGRGVTQDCHDGSDATGGLASDPHCWAGGTPISASAGIRFQF